MCTSHKQGVNSWCCLHINPYSPKVKNIGLNTNCHLCHRENTNLELMGRALWQVHFSWQLMLTNSQHHIVNFIVFQHCWNCLQAYSRPLGPGSSALSALTWRGKKLCYSIWTNSNPINSWLKQMTVSPASPIHKEGLEKKYATVFYFQCPLVKVHLEWF